MRHSQSKAKETEEKRME